MKQFCCIFLFCCFTSIISLTIIATPSSAEGYAVQRGDIIEILVFQYPEYSGQSAVDDLGKITLPALGRIKVHKMLLKDIELEVSERLSKSFGNADYRVVAKMIALRPVSVLGAVKSPGRYPYHSGMLALEAIAAAGGLGISGNDAYRMYVDHMRANQALETSISEYWSAVATKARLEAELLNSDGIKIPLLLTRFEEQKGNDIFTKTESDIFRTRRLHLNKQIKLLKEQKNSLQTEITEIKNHKEKLQKLMKYLERELEKSNSLARKGLTRRFTILSQKNQVSDIRIDYHRSLIALMRAHQNLVEIENKIDSIQNSNRETLLVTLKETALQLDVLKKKMDSQKKFVDQIFINTPSEAFKIEVLRTSSNDKVTKIDIQPESAIEPGDVVRILKTASSGERTPYRTLAIN